MKDRKHSVVRQCPVLFCFSFNSHCKASYVVTKSREQKCPSKKDEEKEKVNGKD